METLKKVLLHPDLRRRVLYTLLLLLVVRILAHIPLPGVDVGALRRFFAENQFLGLINLFSGGTMENFSIVLMGVGPYITASIIMQLMTYVVPSLEALSKEGEYGYRKINYYTRILTVPLAAIQSLGMISFLRRGFQGIPINISGTELLVAVIVVTAGTMLLMWLGELISENGIGNGVSLIITLGIIAGIPGMVKNTYLALFGGGIWDTAKIMSLLVFVGAILASIFVIVFFYDAERRIPVSYASRVRGRRLLGGVDTYLPLKPAQAGVIPIIFALSFLLFPASVAQFLKTARSEVISEWASRVAGFLSNDLVYGILYFALTFLFTFFYTAIIFNPQRIAENLQKQGGYIFGVRPGKETELYLKDVLYKVSSIGALFLAVIAVLPFVLRRLTGLTTIAIGGTGLLIMVSVTLETVEQFKGMLLMRSYEEE
ncbi:preprotein translocase subunit SecY [bacterium]|nr:preprotein translocase subunit SecY [bacterium]